VKILKRKRSESGSVLAEFAIILPLIIFITFGCFQLAFLFVADSVMEYAAFSAARSYIVQITNTENGLQNAADDAGAAAHKAASMVTSLISYFKEENAGINVPGIGELPYSSYSVNHTEIEVFADGVAVGTTIGQDSFSTVNDPEEIEIVVHFDFRPMFPALTIPGLNITEAAVETNAQGQIYLKKSCKMMTTL
jgi:Flp pilus assembly protein TadG